MQEEQQEQQFSSTYSVNSYHYRNIYRSSNCTHEMMRIASVALYITHISSSKRGLVLSRRSMCVCM